MKSVFSQLADFVGKYRGEGINHENQTFIGQLQLEPSIGGFAIHYKAIGKSGVIFHEERTTLALNPEEKICLWSVNTNNPFMLQHDFRRHDQSETKISLVFGYNDASDKKSFREEIEIVLNADQSLEYNYSWGMPGGEFAPRSGLKMQPV